MKFEIHHYYDEDGKKAGFTWLLRSHSGHVIARSERPSRTRGLAERAVQTMREWAPKAKLVDETDRDAAEAA